MTSMLIGLAWTYGTPFALYVLACLNPDQEVPSERRNH
jgi:hypothetical protein